MGPGAWKNHFRTFSNADFSPRRWDARHFSPALCWLHTSSNRGWRSPLSEVLVRLPTAAFPFLDAVPVSVFLLYGSLHTRIYGPQCCTLTEETGLLEESPPLEASIPFRVLGLHKLPVTCLIFFSYYRYLANIARLNELRKT